MQLLELVKNLVVNEFAHVLDTDVGETDEAFGSHDNLTFNDAVFKVSLLFEAVKTMI